MTDTTTLAADDVIEASIESNDDPDHPDAYTIEEVADALEAINNDILAHWGAYADPIDEDAYEIVHEDSDVIVLADHTGHFWRKQCDATPGVEADEQGVLVDTIIQIHHELARAHTDHSWSTAAPVVVQKSSQFQAGEEHVLREIARRTKEKGSVARGVDQLVTTVHGYQKSVWARLTGRNQSTVSRTTSPKED